MAKKWIERLIDETLLLVATQSGLLYVHRRVRRLLPKFAKGAAVAAGLGAAAATMAAGVGVAGGGVVAYRQREKIRSAVARTRATVVRSNGGDSLVNDAASQPSTNT